MEGLVRIKKQIKATIQKAKEEKEIMAWADEHYEGLIHAYEISLIFVETEIKILKHKNRKN